MKITYIHQHFKLPTQGGGGRPYQFAKRLAARGHEVTVLAAGEQRTSTQSEGFTIEWFPTSYANTLGIAGRIASFASFMARTSVHATRVPADVVFASSTPLTVVVPGAIAATVQRARFVFEVRDLWPELPIALGFLPRPLRPLAAALEKFAYHRADAVVALSPYMAAGVRTIAPSADVTTVPNCADRAEFQVEASRETARAHFGVAPSDVVFYYAGSLGVSYDPQWLATFTLLALDKGARVLIAGEGAGVSVLRETLEEAHIPVASVLVGTLSRNEVALLARAGDCAVSTLADVPALEGNSLNKVFDALAAGRPVVANHGGWLTELLTTRSAGWRLPRQVTGDDIARVIEQLADAASRTQIQAAALDASQEFDRDVWFSTFEGVLLGSS